MNLLRFQMPPKLLLEIMHCARNLQISHMYGIHCMMQLEALPPIAESGISVTE